MAKLTMTINEICAEMRAAGIKCSPTRVSAGIVSGCYPFGKVTNVGATNRHTFEVYRVDFEAWLQTKVPESERQQAPSNILHLRRDAASTGKKRAFG